LKIAISLWMFKPGTGGLQSHAEQLCLALQRRGHEVMLITRFYSFLPQGCGYLYQNEKSGDTCINGVTTRPLCLPPHGRLLNWFLSRCVEHRQFTALGVRLYEWLAGRSAQEAFRGAELVHHIGQSTALMGFAAERAARFHGVPFLVQPTCHPDQAGDAYRDHFLFRRADRLLVHTKFERGYFESRYPKIPVDVVGNGIEDRTDGCAERFRNATGVAGPFILFIGRKDPDKGYPLVTAAFRQLRQKMPEVSLVCMGPGDRNGKIPPMPGLLDLDFVPEQMKNDALSACSCLCVPSVGESFGLVYMEAGRYAKPVVARRLPVLEELLDHGRAGLLLGRQGASKNHVELEIDELAAGLFELLNSPERCRKLGQASRKASENFIWPRVVERFEAAYKSMRSPADELSTMLTGIDRRL